MWDRGGSKSTLTKLDDMIDHVSGYLFWPREAQKYENSNKA